MSRQFTVIFAACMATIAMHASAAGDAAVPADDAKTSLRLFSNSEAEYNLTGSTIKGQLDVHDTLLAEPHASEFKDREAAVARECGSPENHEFGALAALALEWIVEKGVGLIVKTTDGEVQKQLAKYTANFDATQSGTFYNSAAPDAGPILAAQCFRLTRQVVKDGKPIIAMDFVGRFSIQHGNLLVIKPLRLYYTKSRAETENGEFGVAISMKQSTIWRENNRGHSEDTLAPDKLISEKIKLDSSHPYYYQRYNLDGADVDRTQRGEKPDPPKQKGRDGKVPESKPEERMIYVALPPWSTWQDTPYGEDRVTTTLSVAEVGKPGWFLKNVAGLLHDNKDALSKNLSAAAEKALGLTDGSSSTKK